MFRGRCDTLSLSEQVAVRAARIARRADEAAAPGRAPPVSRAVQLERIRDKLLPILSLHIDLDQRGRLSRGELASLIGAQVTSHAETNRDDLSELEHRDMVTALMRELLAVALPPEPSELPAEPRAAHSNRPTVATATARIQPLLVERMDVSAAAVLPRAGFEKQ